MKILEINEVNEINEPGFKDRGSVITMGSFDGIHFGHRRLMEYTRDVSIECGTVSVVVTFHPHPLKVLHPEKKVNLITTFEKKIELINSIGIDYIVYITFTHEFANMPPEDFIKNVIVKRLNPAKIIVGHDFGFGIGKSGNTELLRKLSGELNFGLTVMEPVKINGEIASSTVIRRLVTSGQVCKVKEFLGRHYSVHGRVARGSGRGKDLGFPTANIVPEEELFPKDGVYATVAKIEGDFYQSVTNVGSNPTFNEELRRIETYVLNFGRDIYDLEIEVFFVARLRGEIKFGSAKELESQIKEDIELSSEILDLKMGRMA